MNFFSNRSLSGKHHWTYNIYCDLDQKEERKFTVRWKLLGSFMQTPNIHLDYRCTSCCITLSLSVCSMIQTPLTARCSMARDERTPRGHRYVISATGPVRIVINPITSGCYILTALKSTSFFRPKWVILQNGVIIRLHFVALWTISLATDDQHQQFQTKSWFSANWRDRQAHLPKS